MLLKPAGVCVYFRQVVLILSGVTVFVASIFAEVPELARIKAAAESGSAQAQYAFARTFVVSDQNWTKWMALAAAQGYGPAEDEMAWTTNWGEFLTEYSDKKGSAAYLKPKIPKMTQALVYASSAADKGFGRSRLLLACAYARGRLVNRDRVEAYKWMKLAQTTELCSTTVHGSLKDELLKTLSLPEVQEGERRAANFSAGATVLEIRTALVLPKLKLAGLASKEGVFVAIVNGTKLLAGQNAQLNVDGVVVPVNCVSVDSTAAVLTLLPGQARIVLRPGRGAVMLQ